METWELLLQIAAILVTARVFAEIAARLNIPSIIGELTAGVALGPTLFNVIEPNDVLRLLAEIGIILLLFDVGIKTDVERLVRAGSRAVVVAVGGFILPFLFGAGLSYYVFGLSSLVALFIGGTLTATSIGVTIRILADVKRQHSREGQVVLGAAVLDDVFGVLLLAFLYELSVTGKVGWTNFVQIVTFIVIFFVTAPVVGRMLAPWIKLAEKKSTLPGLIPTMLISMVLAFAAMAHVVGAPELLGGFAAGIALSRRFFIPLGLALKSEPRFTIEVQHKMQPLIQIFSPIFFVMVGLSLDLSAVDWGSAFIWLFSLSIAAVAIIGKILAALIISEPLFRRVAIGMAMVPRGEVGLIFAEIGRVSGVFENEIYSGLVLVIAYTTLFSPFWIKLYYRMFSKKRRSSAAAS